MIMIDDLLEPTRTIDARMFDLTVERLCIEFGSRTSRQRVESVLRGCLADLAGSPVGAMPELSERLARQRLSEDSDSIAMPPPSEVAPVEVPAELAELWWRTDSSRRHSTAA
ncbi:hypothetical protein [Nocardia aurantiaca]|uniref:hypothetical protein n=1 Tax=Nocardia aurantiaca TaxID=2675850 RepID=UPI0012B6F703|nr:hypothetical protein [Nocardia aurantiaca]